MKPYTKVFAAILVTGFLGACTVKTPPTPNTIEEPVGEPLTLDQQFLELADTIPDFAGMYYADNGELRVLSASENIASQSIDSVKASISEVFGEQALKQPIKPEVLENALKAESLDTLSVKDAAIVFEPARYSFVDLANWRSSLDDIWLQAGVNRVDIDERKNLIDIAVSDQQALEALKAYIQQKGVPANAVALRVEEGAEAGLSLRDNYPSNVGGLQLEFDGSACTLGFNARLGFTNGFVTNAHCSTQQGVVTPTVYRQGGNQIGREFREATQWTCGSNRCRWADVAFARYDIGEAFEMGGIAYTYSNWDARTETNASASDLEVRDWERFNLPYRIKIVAGNNPIVGDFVYKTGRTTGRTSGSVTQTCVDIRQNGTNIVNRCQTQAGYFALGGDSGSPVYKYSYYSSTGWRVELKGINWSQGGNNVFSPMANINASLGNLQVLRPTTRRFSFDGDDAGSPDFRQLTVAHTDDQVTIDIRFYSAADLANAGHNVYLYGSYRDTINFSTSSFSLRRDYGNDGHFESTLTSGTVTRPNSTTLRISFRGSYMPDIHEKQVWVYSQRSRDRMPNSGYLQMR